MKKAVPKKILVAMEEDKRTDEHFYAFFPSLKGDSAVLSHMDCLCSTKLFVHNRKKQNLYHFSKMILLSMKDKAVPKRTKQTRKLVLFFYFYYLSFFTEQCLYSFLYLFSLLLWLFVSQ